MHILQGYVRWIALCHSANSVTVRAPFSTPAMGFKLATETWTWGLTLTQPIKTCRLWVIISDSHRMHWSRSGDKSQFRRRGTLLKEHYLAAFLIASRVSLVCFWIRPSNSSDLPSTHWSLLSVSLAPFCFNLPLMMLRSPLISSFVIYLQLVLSAACFGGKGSTVNGILEPKRQSRERGPARLHQYRERWPEPVWIRDA